MLQTIIKKIYPMTQSSCYRFSFSEKSFMQVYLQSFQNRQRNQQDLLSTLEVDKIESLLTVIGIVDKSYKNNIILKPKLKEDLLKRTENILREKRQIDVPHIKGLLLVLALNKLENKTLFNSIQKFIDNYHQELQPDHLITILETIVFNKLFEKYDYDITFLLNQLNQLIEQSEDLFGGDLVRKTLEILIYFQKINNTQFQSLNQFQNLFELIQSINIIIGRFISYKEEQPKCIKYHQFLQEVSDQYFANIFKIVQVQDQFDQLALINQKQKLKYKEFFNLHQTLQNDVQSIIDKQLTEDKLQSLVFSKEKLDIISDYLKKYLSAPPLYLPKAIQNIIGNVYISIIHDFTNVNKSKYTLNEILPFLIFLVKTKSQLKLDKDSIVLFTYFVKDEKSIFNLQRLIESISILYLQSKHVPMEPLHKLVAMIEERIINLSKSYVKPTQPLLQLFQSIVMLHPYQPENLKYLLEYFSFGQVLEKITWVELLVKFIPSLGIVTKNMSNQLLSGEADKLNLQTELRDLWEKLTLILIQRIDHINIDKIPSLLIYMSHSSFFISYNIPKLLINLKRIILNNLESYNGLQLCEIIFSYARMNYNEVTFYISIAKHIQDNQIELNFQSATGIMWALAVSKVKIDHFIIHLESYINEKFEKGSEELIIQYFQANTILNRQPPENITKDFYNQIKQSYGQKQVQFKIYLQMMIGLLLNQYDQTIWMDLMKCVQDHRDQIKKQPLLCHQLFLIYFKYNYSNPIQSVQRDLKMLSSILDPEILKDYCINFKQTKSSEMELNIVKILKEMQKDGEIVPTENKKDCIFVDDIIADPKIAFILANFIPYQCDYRLGDLCFEVNGPRHYLRKVNQSYEIEEEELDGPTRLKKQSIESCGFKYIEISHRLYESKKDQNFKEQLKQLII